MQHFIDHLACNLRAGSEIERFHFEEYLMNFQNNFTIPSEGFKLKSSFLTDSFCIEKSMRKFLFRLAN